ncbi:MAG: hypothetical protein AAFN70_12060, partial [Planctomycetota bacterium]
MVSALLFVLLNIPQLADAQSLRTIPGRYVIVRTDLPADKISQADVDGFDAAVPQWLDAWKLNPDAAANWRLTAYVMSDKAAMRRAGILPDTIPDFGHGYQQGKTAWVIAQSGDYYTRHLLLHEGVHGAAWAMFGGAGPPWFMEGNAEWLATHRGVGTQLQIGVIPATEAEVPFWGRYAVIRDAAKNARVPSIESVMRYSNVAHRRVEPYAWSWAAVMLLYHHADTRQIFLDMPAQGQLPATAFTRTLYTQLKNQWPQVRLRWSLLADELDYGYDPVRSSIPLAKTLPPTLQSEAHVTRVAADRGWQSAGTLIPAGTTIQITAKGKYTLADSPRPWTCYPDGVTIQYHRGMPLGKLVAAVVPVDPKTSRYAPAVRWQAIGSEGQLQVREKSWLMLRINESSNQLFD